MLPAGDVGGPNTRLGMFIRATPRPAPAEVRTCATDAHRSLDSTIIPALEQRTFLDAFRAKAPMQALVAAVPEHVIVHPDPGLLGAAVAGAIQARSARP